MGKDTLLGWTTWEHWGVASAGLPNLVVRNVALGLGGLSYLMESGLHEELDVHTPQSNLVHYRGLCILHVTYT